jgi:hypothetical protein
MIRDNLLFDMSLPPDWESRLQMTYIEPLPPNAQNLPIVQKEEPPPRLNVVVSRVPTEETVPSAACEKFLTQTAMIVPGLELLEDPGAFMFDDGVEGVLTSVRFAASSQLWLLQLHAFRIDDGLLSQLVATVADTDAAQREEELRALLATFELKSQKS